MGDLRIGQRVRTMRPLWDDRDRPNAHEIPTGALATIVRCWESMAGPCIGLVFDGESDADRDLTAQPSEVEPLPPDIPRQAVKDLLAAVEKRAAEHQLRTIDATSYTWRDATSRVEELDHFAESLRRLLRTGS